jgi:glycosyltransferase involved in cell wall biosynthesis
MDKIKLAIVVPCFNEEEVLSETIRRLSIMLDSLIAEKKISFDSFILFVNDGSSDRTWDMIKQYNIENHYVCGVKLASNVGHQRALIAGLNVAKDYVDAIITIDADLQDDINVMPEMLQHFYEGYDIVYGVRNKRDTDTWFKRNTALAFYKLMHNLGVKSVYNHADYRLMSKRAVKELCSYPERNLFIRGMVPLIGYKSTCVYYNRSERFAGVSKYPLKKMLNFAVDGITSFSVKPVRLVLMSGLFFIVISFCILIYVICSLFYGCSQQGWASIILSIWFVGGAILVGLGIVGEYIGKIYIEVKRRPLYNIEKILIKKEDEGTDH